MAATTVDRQTIKYQITREIKLTLKAATAIPAGVITCVDATGMAVNGADTAGLRVMGISSHAASNVAPLADTYILVERGVFVLANDGTIALADVGTLATVLDNQTVSKAATTANDIGAGYIEDVTSEGVVIAMLGGRVDAA